MTPHEEDKKSMYDTVLGVFDQFQEAIAAIPELETTIADFRSTVTSIAAFDEQAKTARDGKYESKKNAKHTLISLIVPAVNSLHSYARKNKTEDVIQLTDKITEPSLSRLNKTEFNSKIETLYQSLDANKENLTGYGVTAENIDSIKAAVDAYDAAEKEHLTSGSHKTAAHISMEEAFDNADDILKEDIDGMMEHFKLINSEFYNMYNASRVIKDISGSKSKEAPPVETTQQSQQ